MSNVWETFCPNICDIFCPNICDIICPNICDIFCPSIWDLVFQIYVWYFVQIYDLVSQIYVMNQDKYMWTISINICSFILKYCYFLHPSLQSFQYKKFIKELCGYTQTIKSSAHDDAPDALSGLTNYIRNLLSEIYQ